MPGLSPEGGPLAAFAPAAAGSILVADRGGAGRVLRPLAVTLAAFVAVDAALVAIRIAADVAEPGPAGLLAQPAAGPGPGVTVVGAGLLAGASAAGTSPVRPPGPNVLVPRDRATRPKPNPRRRAGRP